jgi:hypothetical protein
VGRRGDGHDLEGRAGLDLGVLLAYIWCLVHGLVALGNDTMTLGKVGVVRYSVIFVLTYRAKAQSLPTGSVLRHSFAAQSVGVWKLMRHSSYYSSKARDVHH